MKRVLMAMFVFGLCAVPTSVFAQEKGKVGVTMGTPASFGLIWHATEKVALRPDFSFATSSSESDFGENDSHSYAFGISALFYVKKWDQVSAYVSPRYAWSHTGTTSRAEGDFFIEDEVKSTNNSQNFSGSFGVQGWIGSRFSAYGEVGVSYFHSDSKSGVTDSKSSGNSFATRSGVGIAFYF